MIVILAYDGLEYEYVKEFGMKNLMQESFGKTDISEFSEPRTVVIWSSFLAGKNLEKRVLSLGKDFWKFKLKPQETFFSKFKKWKAIDVPGFTYKFENHKKEKELLKAFFDGRASVREYDKIAFENHKENKEEFFEELDKGYEIIMGYFALADVIGHLSFGIKTKMKIVYKELDKIAEEVKMRLDKDSKLLIISDHGMKAVGRFGDHNNYGFWSLNFSFELENPKITEFRKIVEKF
ncbi:MAG: alkaline phosphatase family protein [Candidatus Aenigmarchaeota archaeon]|nr:alkaline phosphatase family protein [Candidatus Aenigmarchaeota archaeon]